MAYDNAKNLLPLSWRGIRVYYSGLRTKGGNDEIEHKKPRRPGSISEPQGPNSDVITASVLFLNNGLRFATRVYAEPWHPVVHGRFIAACRDDSVGELVHPEFGTMTAVCLTWESVLATTSQDGARVECTWRQTTELDQDFGGPSPLALADAAAADLDLLMTKLRVQASLLTLPSASFSFVDALKSIRGVADQTALFASRGEATFASVQYNLDLTRDAITRSKDVSLASSRAAVERMQAAMHTAEAEAFVNGTVGEFRVPFDTTLARVARILSATVTDLLQLNPLLARDTRVRADTIVRYTR